MRMILQDDKKYSSEQDTIIRSKSWLGFLTNGSFVFFADELSGSEGVVTSCSIFADVPNVDDFRAAAITQMHLNAVPLPVIGNDGSRSYTWYNRYGEGTTLIIRDAKPSRKAGTMIKLIVKR
jgi:hypothetical protein